MREADRLAIILTEVLLYEDSRLYDEVRENFEAVKRNEFDSYYISKYYRSLIRYEDFKIFSRKVFDAICRFR